MTTEQTPRQKLEAAMAALGLTISSEFVPFSKSRNAKVDKANGKPWRSLNWRVTLIRRWEVPALASSKPILTTDYAAGEAHCPAYKASVKQMGNRDSIMRDAAIAYECEHGRPALAYDSANSPRGFAVSEVKGGKSIEPDACDVMHSLIMDSDVLDASGFEEWASNYGYDIDSRSAEATYRACLEIALKLRNGIGEEGLKLLRDACQDY